MIRRHFLMNDDQETMSVIKYTTSDGNLFDLQGLLDFWTSLNTEL
jgi:ATP-dependent RNA circularization protein (DNA/RNA ligase family)